MFARFRSRAQGRAPGAGRVQSYCGAGRPVATIHQSHSSVA